MFLLSHGQKNAFITMVGFNPDVIQQKIPPVTPDQTGPNTVTTEIVDQYHNVRNNIEPGCITDEEKITSNHFTNYMRFNFL